VKQAFDAIVIGGGAAGLMCVIEAGKRGRRVAVLDHAEHIGKKILISGGGRCNFTNLYCRPENFLSANPHFAKSALARYTPTDFIALVERYGIPYHEKTLGQLFCDRSAQDILSMLEEECRRAQVQIFTKQRVIEVSRPSEFVVRTSDDEFHAPALVIASGGLSIPKMGATSFGYDVARQFGLKIVETRPALAPFVLNELDRKRWCDLAGIAAEVVASADHQQFREKMLITHRGLSGPAILQISSYWQKSQPITIDLAPGRELVQALKSGKRDLPTFKSNLRDFLPNRFADRWAEIYPPSRWTDPALEETERHLHRWQIIPEGTEGYAKAEVTAGGVDTGELSARTMESRRVPGLYFIGEVVDVTGHLGGFNFQWAWASGYAAGLAV
jgi:predicted Rossmann fold flavoprotein